MILQSATVVALVGVSNVWNGNRSDNEQDDSLIKKSTSVLRIPLSALIIVIGLTAILFAVGNHLPQLNYRAWQSILLVGCGMGSCSAIPIVLRRVTWIPRMMISVFSAAWIGILLALFDWLFLSFTTWAGWPPEMILVREFGLGDSQGAHAWFAIAPCVCLLSSSLVVFLGLPFESEHTPWPMRFAAAAILVGLIPVYGLWVLVRPPEYVDSDHTNPPEIEQLVELSYVIERAGIEDIGVDWDQQTAKSKRAFFDQIDKDLEALHELLRTDSRRAIDYSPEPNMTRLLSFRSTTIAFAFRGQFALENGYGEKAAECFLDAVRLGYWVRSEGLYIDAVIGSNCANDGLAALSEFRTALPPDSCRECARELMVLANASEGVEAFDRRDRGWVQVALGWHGRMLQALEDISGDTSVFGESNYSILFGQQRALMHLVATELALIAYQAENGKLPVGLAELVPAYLSDVPSDPFDPRGGELRYRKTDDGYLLYSVGENQNDDGGVPPNDSDSEFDLIPGSGDLTLESYFTEEGSI
ncbi:MAG: hypothetical protein AAGG48_07095 [Planctomycetota bacterium]